MKTSAIAGKFRPRDNNWIRRRWLDFRNGHGIYLIFFLTFAQFVIIQYSLLLNRSPMFHSIPLWAFTVAFVAIYVSAGELIGYWHRKTQYNVDNQTHFEQNRVGAMIQLFLIDLIDGKITDEEKEHMRRYLLKITRPSRRPIIGTNEERPDVGHKKI